MITNIFCKQTIPFELLTQKRIFFLKFHANVKGVIQIGTNRPSNHFINTMGRYRISSELNLVEKPTKPKVKVKNINKLIDIYISLTACNGPVNHYFDCIFIIEWPFPLF